MNCPWKYLGEVISREDFLSTIHRGLAQPKTFFVLLQAYSWMGWCHPTFFRWHYKDILTLWFAFFSHILCMLIIIKKTLETEEITEAFQEWSRNLLKKDDKSFSFLIWLLSQTLSTPLLTTPQSHLHLITICTLFVISFQILFQML